MNTTKTPKEPIVFLQHIAEAIMIIEEYMRGVDLDAFLDSIQIQDAVIRRLEIIGEAVKNLPAGVKNMYPEVPWRTLAGFRDVLIHGYFGIDNDVVWQTFTEDLPVLKKQIQKILTDLSGAN